MSFGFGWAAHLKLQTEERKAPTFLKWSEALTPSGIFKKESILKNF